MGQVESDIELVTSIAVAKFESMKRTLSAVSGKPREDLIHADEQEVLDEDQVEVVKYDDVTGNNNEEFEEVTNENLSASFKE